MKLSLATVLLAATTAVAAADLSDLRSLALPDQFGVEDSLAAHRGHVVVVMVVTAKRLRNVRPWERDLRERFDELDVLRIADVPADSPASGDRVAEKLREQVPEGVSVLIDLERKWATALGLDTSRPNVLLIGSDNELVAAFRGRHDPVLAAELMAALEMELAGP